MGAFVYDNRVAAADPRIQTGSQVSPGGYLQVYGEQKSRSYSAYGQATAELVADTHLTLGLRYTDETLHLNGQYQNQAGALIRSSPFSSEVSYSPLTYRVALDHQFTPDVLGYVSFNHGFKAGGFNAITPDTPAFLPETLNAYEVGLKSEFAGRVRLNVAAFYYDYKNIQVAIVPGGSGQIFTNAGAARNYGADLGLDIAATENLTFTIGAGYLDARYKEYFNAQGFTATGAAINIPNAAGQSLSFAPPTSGNVSADYKIRSSVGTFSLTGNVAYLDHYYITPASIPVLPSTIQVAASVEWTANGDKPLSVRLWGRNLTDQYVPMGMTSSSGGWYGTYAEPRVYGVNVRKSF